VFLSTRVLVMSARPGRIHGEFIIDEPHPREESFRGSEKFARYCALLSGALSAASSDSAAEAGIGS
jgi:NitT/TauT family transport system ATP-binding protein